MFISKLKSYNKVTTAEEAGNNYMQGSKFSGLVNLELDILRTHSYYKGV